MLKAQYYKYFVGRFEHSSLARRVQEQRVEYGELLMTRRPTAIELIIRNNMRLQSTTAVQNPEWAT